eukprot:TRINITY_DN5528_c0_g1_i1.p1 TRINITY_DN5528_c0_g1~~TRINITY_DN5528_c0_g1_i1.p1  ORF type:complete len:390 (-),score=114.41 TRINITY_DN5528_c0_g1_i1:191-1360(-)
MLKGVTVLEIAGLAPGPHCGMILADFGAKVIRVDRCQDQMTIPRDLLSRGKKSLAINLKSPKGVEILLQLLEKTDVLIDTFRAGVTERLGFGPDIALKRNPRLVYARLTGWGQKGPLAKTAGHDINYIAISGALQAIGGKDQAPVPPVNLLGDFAAGGLMCAMGIIMALYEREKSGKGQVVDSAMSDGTAYLSTFIHSMKSNGMWNDVEKGDNLLDGPYYGVYRTCDGKYMAVGCIEEQFYQLFLRGLDLNANEIPDRNDHSQWENLRKIFQRKFAEKSRDEWVKIFSQFPDACVSPVLTTSEAIAFDHNHERTTFIRDGDGIDQPSPAPRFSRTDSELLQVENSRKIKYPSSGEDTVEILTHYGFSAKSIRDFIQEGLISQSQLSAKL